MPWYTLCGLDSIHAQLVKVRVPATSGNLGPGFDVLGMALGMWNRVKVRVGGPAGIRVRGEGVGLLSTGTDNLVYLAASRLFEEAGIPVPALGISSYNGIPVGRGLGSSAAAVVAGLVAADVLCGNVVPRQRLLELATELEGHPDNVAPALLGGCQIVVRDGHRIVTTAVRVPRGLRCVAFIPDQPMATGESRALLQDTVPREHAVFNIGRTAMLVNALNQGNLEHMALATQDRLHQPERQHVFGAMKHIIKAALDAGALAAFLSGGGSSVLAITNGREMTIGYEMAEAAVRAGAFGQFKVMRPSIHGARVLEVV